MSESNNKKNLEEIRKSEAFESLAPYRDPKSWETLTPEERELLGILFVMQGDYQLKQEKKAANECFDLALQVAPASSRVLYRKGLALSRHEENVHFLHQAAEALEQACQMDAEFYPAWYELACTWSRIGVLNRDLKAFQKSDKLFDKASQLGEGLDKETLADCYWRWGLCWFLYGKASGEITDFRKALEKYQHTAKLSCQKEEFWNDYGNALVEHSCLGGQTKGFYEAIHLYRRAVKQAPDYFEGWYNLACTYHHLFLLDQKEENFLSATECYEQACKLKPEYGVLWLKWGTLHATLGKYQKNEKLLQSAIQKFRRADFFDPNHPQILRCLGESLMLCGMYMENLTFLKEAEKKFTKSAEIDGKDPITWYFLGTCYNELGRYFEEEEYFLKAIEKFRLGLKVNAKDSLLWYGLALSHQALGEMLRDKKMMELADKFCARVVEFGGKLAPQFWLDWGVVLIRLSEFQDSVDVLESARQKLEEGIAYYNNLDELEFFDPEILYHYACVLDLLGDYYEDGAYFEKAIRLLERLQEADPGNTAVRYHLALSYSHQGDVCSDLQSFYLALEHFELIFEQDPEDEMALHDWGITLIHLAQAIHDPAQPEESGQLYHLAEKKLVMSASLGNAQAYYNLACLHSLCGQNKNAILFLEKAVKSGALPPIDDILHDDWLEGVRQTKQFRSFLNELHKQQ